MSKTPFIVALISSCNLVSAEVITDGSLGKQVTLDAPDYHITQDLGKKVGNNLFHSFDSFNISKGESVTFSDDNDSRLSLPQRRKSIAKSSLFSKTYWIPADAGMTRNF